MSELVCPKDQGAMRSIERNGVTIERCSECGGIFLDRGELEGLIQAESVYTARENRDDDDDESRGSQGGSHGGQGESRGGHGGSHNTQQPGRKKKRGGFLSDMLDFG